MSSTAPDPSEHPAPPTYLVNIESPVESTPLRSTDIYAVAAPALSTNKRHLHWQNERARVAAAFVAAGLSHARTLAFTTCGESHWILRSQTDQTRYRLVPDHCHDRFCRPCARDRSSVVTRNVKALLAGRPARHLTLTIKHTHKPLANQLDHLYHAYRRLRQRKLWKDRVDGAAAMLELTYNHQNGEWHPHLHAVLSGKYFPVDALRAAWLNVTGDSSIVDIRYIQNSDHTAAYVAKYATKAVDTSVTMNKPALVAAIEALRGRRSILTSGKWAHARLTVPPRDDDWQCVCHVNELPFTKRLPDDLRKALSQWVQQHAERKARPVATIPLTINQKGRPP